MFKVSIITPANLSHPGLAIAAARAGATIFFDLEFCPEGEMQQVEDNLAQTLRNLSESAVLGLRLRPDQAAFSHPVLTKLSTRSHGVVLTGWDVHSAVKAAAALPFSEKRDWYLEMSDASQIESLDHVEISLTGLVAKGHECGGWVGESSSFILGQRLLSKTTHPVHVQGGVGPRTAAACRAAGAAGVVLDDQLWLMPESPFPREWKGTLKNLNGSETIVCGERLGRPVRVLSRPGFTAVEKLRNLSEEAEMEDDARKWRDNAPSLIGWGDPSLTAWPIGQAVGMAASLAKRHRTAGRLVRAILEESESSLRSASILKSLSPDAPLARSHGTRYPIVQGPMTRVSDVAAFAHAVAKAGGLPMLALALMREAQVEALLRKCKDLMADRSWGIGILGFVPPELREEQLSVVRKLRPPFAIIAGGRPEHAVELENEGIATYLHVPTPQLLELFIGRGSRRFIFEGRECGGHVGPLCSFCLWESMIEKLLEVPEKAASEIHVLFAGGIHDGRTGAMISALATPLAAHGIKVGVLMGTAYLFTTEAVECGAVVAKFQQEALKCTRTINLETGPGHASRCVVTPFAKEFYDKRRELSLKKVNQLEINQALDRLVLGRLRVASKGLIRNGNDLLSVNELDQYKQGMYMIGQAATLRESLVSLEELHRDVSEGSVRILSEARGIGERDAKGKPPSDVAIVGMAVLLPGAHNLDRYWSNILQKVNALREIPPHRWDWRLYFDKEKTSADKIYSKWGGFLDELPFDPIEFGIPPSAAKFIEPMQLLALEGVRRALTDAGYEDGNFDRENTAVVFGASGGLGDLGQLYATRCELPRVVGQVGDDVRNRLPEWSGDSFPGLLLNVIAGRIANRFDLGGANYVIDAACASSLASLESAARELESGQCNVAIAGGVDCMQSPFGYFCFSRTQALSASGEVRSFDERADGIVISEGVGVLVMKRLADAERDGDRIYAVIKGFGSSSDGRGASMTVPTNSGQIRAMRRAYRKAGFSPATIGLYEAHGTGTTLGDRVELESLSLLLRENGASPKSCAVGSIKSLIGHTKGAAGVSGLIKAALALHYKVLAPHAGVENPLPLLRDASSPVYMHKEPAPWIGHPWHPRRAAVSAFGFGGTNFHAVLEEYNGAVAPRAPGSKDWPCELFAWKSRDRETLLTAMSGFRRTVSSENKTLRELAHLLAVAQPAEGTAALCLTASSLEELAEAIDSAISCLRESKKASSNIQFKIRSAEGGEPARVAFLFPGQGSQYPAAASETARFFREIEEALAHADFHLDGLFPKRMAQYLNPPAGFSEPEQRRAKEELSQTQIAQPVVGALSCGFLDVLLRLGVEPDFLGGHSFGEYTALHAAGVLSREEFYRLAAVRGQAMQSACEGARGGMAAVSAAREDISARIEGTSIVVANHNSPRQTVISGPMEVLKKVLADLEQDGIPSKLLPVAGAFHCSMMQEAQRPLVEAISAATFSRPRHTVFSNSTARPYAIDPEVIRHQLEGHMLSRVEFVGEIEAMYEAGARILIEVGPRNILSTLVAEILKDRQDAVIVALDAQGGGLRGFLNALGRLYVEGLQIDLRELFVSRGIETVPTAVAGPDSRPDGRHWLLSGGGIRKPEEAPGMAGKMALLTQASILEGVKPAASSPSSNNQPAETMTNRKEPSPEAPESENGSRARPDQTALLAYADYQETMRHFLKVQEEVMKQFLSRGGGAPVSTAAGSNIAVPRVARPTAVPEISPPAKGDVIAAAPIPNVETAVELRENRQLTAANGAVWESREELIKILLDIVSERTGYPTEMLELDHDLEADLGIDSIKRVEIFGVIQYQLPSSVFEKLVQSNQDLTTVRTLNGWVEMLLAPGEVVGAQEAPNPAEST